MTHENNKGFTQETKLLQRLCDAKGTERENGHACGTHANTRVQCSAEYTRHTYSLH